MKVIKTEFEGLLVFELDVYYDDRGYFYESWQQDKYKNAGIKESFIQDNKSHSNKNVLRGLHFQKSNPQGQLVWVSEGEIYDVCVDLRESSPTFGKSFTKKLSANKPIQIYMPPGFAHGFCVLSDKATVNYKCTGHYDPSDESGVLWSSLGINWPIDSPKISPRDSNFKSLGELSSDMLPKVANIKK